ncbi:MAG: hypothetical protein ACYS32_15705 [Planctomycetota bacterium]|jgi:hypothetical protein
MLRLGQWLWAKDVVGMRRRAPEAHVSLLVENEKMKKLRRTIMVGGIFITIIFSIIGCARNPMSCEATTNPFPTLDSNDQYLIKLNENIRQVCSFTADIERGQSYHRKITDGVVFCLTPDSFWQENGGWRINISDEIGETCDDNFAGIVTPPFRGKDNATYIQGWQFQNENNIDSDTSSIYPNSLTRDFIFVFTQTDHDAIFNDAFSNPHDEDTNLAGIPTSRGILTIVDLELGNLIPNEIAWIESMEFEVKIYLPPE